MYSILLVDDEAMIRNGIKNSMDWQKIGIGKVYTAPSARKAIELLQANKPDILLTDICMSEMNGIELLRIAKKLLPELRTIVLTGYSSFSYAQDCIKLQVHDFLLKPIDETDLENAILKQIDVLSKRIIKSEKIPTINAFNDRMQFEHSLRMLVHNKFNADEALSFCLENNIAIDKNIRACLLYANQQYGGYSTTVIHSLCMQIISKSNKGVVFMDDDGVICATIYDSSEKEITSLLNIIKGSLMNEYNIDITFIIGSLVNSFLHVFNSLKKARTQIPKDIDISNSNKNHYDKVTYYEDRMIAEIDNSDKLNSLFDEYQKTLIDAGHSDSSIRKRCFETACKLYFAYISTLETQSSDSLDVLAESLMLLKKEDAINVTHDFILKMHNFEETSRNKLIIQAKKYISSHLSEDMSVACLANNLYVSPSYFSRLFKRETGKTCSEFIVSKRIEQAEKLLETTTIQTGRIALMVGYNDVNYFSLTFKKHTNLSPTQYREKHK